MSGFLARKYLFIQPGRDFLPVFLRAADQPGPEEPKDVRDQHGLPQVDHHDHYYLEERQDVLDQQGLPQYDCAKFF